LSSAGGWWASFWAGRHSRWRRTTSSSRRRRCADAGKIVTPNDYPVSPGRVLHESLTGDAAAAVTRAVSSIEHSADARDGRYRVTLKLSIVRIDGREYRYFDGTTVTRR
jgi:hypothetical protein